MNVSLNNNIPGFFSLLVLVLLLFQTRSAFARDTLIQHKLWLYLILSAFIGQALDILGWLLPVQPSGLYYVVVGVDTLLYASDFALCTMAALFVEYNTHFNKKLLDNFIRMILPVGILYLAVLVVNLFVPFLFSVSRGGAFVHGPLHLLAILICLLPMFAAVVRQVIYRRQKRSALRLALLGCLVLPLIGIVIQMLGITPVPVVYPSVTLAVLWCTLFYLNDTLDTDYLTGLLNKRGLERQFINLNTFDKYLFLIFMDFDNFKTINDRYGHAEGDRALRDFSHSLRVSASPGDLVARLYGDEFVVVMAARAQNAGKNFVKKVLAEDQHKNEMYNKAYRADFSYGISFCPPGTKPDREMLLTQAEKDMYTDKKKPLNIKNTENG